MLVHLILIYMISLTVASETKYIDLLPEKEKQEFLQRIARRILEEVEPGDRKNAVPDITKDELEVHNDFINKILKEEKANIRKFAEAVTDNGNLTVKPLDRAGKDKKQKNKHIDLTLRTRDEDEGDEGKEGGDASKISEEKDIQVKTKISEVDQTDFQNQSTTEEPKEITTETSSQATTVNPEDFLENTEKPTKNVKENQSFSQSNGSLNIEVKNITENNSDVKVAEKMTDETTQNMFVDEQTQTSTQEIETTSKNDPNTHNKKNEIEKESIIINIRRSGGTANEVDDKNKQIADIKSKEFVKTKILRTADITETPKENITTEISEKIEDVLPIIPILDKINDTDITTSERTETNEESINSKTETPEVLKNTTSNEVTVTESNEKVMKNDETTKSADVVLTEARTNDSPVTDNEDKTTLLEITTNINIDHTVRNVKALDIEENNQKDADINKVAFVNVKKNNNTVTENIPDTKNIINDYKKEPVAQILKKNPLRTLFIDLETLQQSNYNKITVSKDKLVSDSVKHSELLNINNNDNLQLDNKHIDMFGPHSITNINDLENKSLDKDKIYKLALENEVTTEKINVLTPITPKPIDVSQLVDSMELIEHKIKKKDNPHNNIEKHGKEIKSEKVKVNGKIDLRTINKIVPHEVYEIAANEAPFIIKDGVNLNQDQPNIAPIYNYSPNNAFYNGINNQGPNPSDLEIPSGDKNIERTDKIKLDSFLRNDDPNREFTFEYPDGLGKDSRLTVDNTINGHGNEENIERSSCNKDRKKKKKEEEEQRFKDKIREARIFMYEKKYFGAVEVKNYTSLSEELLEIKRSDDKYTTSNIGMDYYFPNTLEPGDRAKEIYKKQRDTLSELIKRIGEIIDKKIYLAPFENIQKRPEHVKINNVINLRQKKKKKKEEPKPNIEKIKQILEMTPTVDLIPTMNALLNMNLGRQGMEDIEVYIDVLADMVQSNNHALEHYDWIGTTVDIQGAITKLIFLADSVLKKQYINPLDYELLKYVTYLHKQAVKNNKISTDVRTLLPKPKRDKNKILTNKGLFDRVWLYRGHRDLETVIKKHDIYMFKKFLKELQNKLYELHTAIKQIADVTTYKNQHWFKNLKELYLDPFKLRNLELLLHLTTAKLLDSIESSSGKGLEEDYIKYMEKNPTEFENVKSDSEFLLKILEFMDKNVENSIKV